MDSAWRLACRSPLFANVMTWSAQRRNSFALVSVVRIRSYLNSDVTIFRNIAFRWLVVRFSFKLAFRCLIRPIYSPSSLSSSGGANPSSFIPRDRPISDNTSLISFSDLRPKFFVLSISASVLLTSCQILLISAFFRQLALRTDS